ncbi:MAG: DUF4105 domain-containing protein, partial [Gammaproteobacteria bacterium]|nr:DUF4105 domain-containing protein [Gammaproteobacteria bacterium]
MHLVNTQWLNAITLFFILCLLSPAAYSDTQQDNSTVPEQLLNSINSNKLWQNSEWLNLLHYQKHAEGEYLSNVVEDKFFNAEDGKQNPQTELIATLQALYNTDVSVPDEHAQCRFISRLNWLNKQLDNGLTKLPTVNCPLYEEWRKLMPAHKATLVFPAYHLNSPSSMYGHTLLRIDPPAIDNSSAWLSMAVNFGANINNDDNSILYAFKGLSGGYPGIFIVTPYYNKIKEYNRYENRDIWEYPLNLTPQETERMVLHLWELKEINFNYYFFDENCSYRLLELLQVARPGLELTDEFGLTAIPVDTVRSIEKADLITGIVYRPSQSTNVYYLLNQLSSEQQDFVYLLSQDADLINHETFKQYEQATQNIILEAAYHYLRVRQNDEVRSDKIAKNSYKLLQAINNDANFTSKTTVFKESQRPEKGHLSKRLTLTAGEDDDLNYAEIGFRMSFHSLEDPLDGFLEGAQINLGSVSIRAYEDEVQIQQFDIIDIFSLTPRNQFFQPLSWRVYSGLEQQLINGRDHLTGHVTAGAGVAYKPWIHGYAYGLLMTRLELNSQFSRNVEPALGIS